MDKCRLGLYGILCTAVGVFAALLIELLIVLGGQEIPILLFLLVMLGTAGILWFAFRKSLLKVSLLLTVICGGVFVSVFFLHSKEEAFRDGSDYQNADIDGGVKNFFADQRIMLLVPHQDDELNVLGGTIEEYIHYGSEVYVVYLTNGDFLTSSDKNPTETRYAEAIACLEKQGVAEDHVIFLGYGDKWQADGPHIYNAPSGEVVHSKAGFTTTYGSTSHPPYRDGVEYTIENLMMDMETVILEYRPDTIICCDYDEHQDHRARSMLFEKIMGRILRGGSDYHPLVYKGYAYRTAWNGVYDFYHLNIKSTSCLSKRWFEPQVAYYSWENRVRFPVSASGLSRSLLGSGQYNLLQCHDSQGACLKAQGVINGDKVFWERRTTSLCSKADIMVSSGDGSRLNDFMLLDNNCIVDTNHLPYDGVWIPETADTVKLAAVTLPEQSDVASIVLYDHPSPEQNVLQAVISFDNGQRLETGPLDPIGSATTIAVDQKQIASFTVELTQVEGFEAGLMELEAFATSDDTETGFVQLMDCNGDFIYDYITDASGEVLLQIYGYGMIPEICPENYQISLNNEACEAIWSDGGIMISCPAGESVMVSVSSIGGNAWDRAYVRNPGLPHKKWMEVCQFAELLQLEIPDNEEIDAILQHFTIRKFTTKLWNFYYHMTH